LKELGLQLLSVEELSRVVDRVLDRNAALIEERGAAATGQLIGFVMSEVRGRADAKTVGRLIGERIGKRLTEEKT
jgi:Glu-tRNA(Gln) amidotransferase subunit E-like FAD-binding protein